MNQEQLNALPKQMRTQWDNLESYVQKELKAGRTPKREATQRMTEIIDVARLNKQSPSQLNGQGDQGMIGNVQPAPNLIGEAAKLMAWVETDQARGRSPNPKDLRRLSELDSIARSRLTPEQYNAGMVHLNAAKAQILSDMTIQDQSQARQVEEIQRLAGINHKTNALSDALRSVTGGGRFSTGTLETQEQLDDLRAGNKVTVPVKKHRLDKALISEQVQEKFGVSLEEHKSRLDDLAEAQLNDPDRFKTLSEEYGIDAKTVKDWSDGGYLEFGLQERFAEQDKDLPDTEEIQPSKDDIMKMDIATAAANHDESPGDTLGHFRQENKDLLEQDSRHGDVARSFDAVESFYEEQESQNG